MTTDDGFQQDGQGWYIYKDPNAVLEYTLDFDVVRNSWLNGDTLAAAEFTVPAGITRASQSFTTKVATVWLSGGTVDATYVISCHITTAGGRQDDRSFRVIMKQR